MKLAGASTTVVAAVAGGTSRLNVTCNGNIIVLQVITRTSSKIKRYYNSNPDNCARQLAVLQHKVPPSFSDFAVVQLCDGTVLVTLRATEDAEIEEISRHNLNSPAACVERL